jgi:hypothetical protein
VTFLQLVIMKILCSEKIALTQRAYVELFGAHSTIIERKKEEK